MSTNFDAPGMEYSQRLLSVRHHYTKKDYEKASQYREISSIRPRKWDNKLHL